MMTSRAMIRTIAETTWRSPFVVGIGGPTAAGKSTLAHALAAHYQEFGVCLIDQDSYYLDRSHLSETQREALNYDEPSALDHDLILRHLESLISGRLVRKPCYDFRTHTRTVGCQWLQPESLIILEGLHAFWDARIRSVLSLKVYLDADPDVRLIRRLQRDTLERGRSAESVISQYVDTVRPMQKRHVEPSKEHADLVLDTTESPAKAAAELMDAVSARFHPGTAQLTTLATC